jgi:hypothetical protein
MSRTHHAVKVSAVAALGLAMSIGLATTPAHADPSLSMSTQLYITPVPGSPLNEGHPDQQVVDIRGVVAMSEAAAKDSIDHGYTIELRYWGDDEYSDDLILGPIHPGNVFAGSDGLHFQHNVKLAHFQLNEDDETGASGPFAGGFGEDEIYVGSRLLDPSGKTVALVESNPIRRLF